MILPPAGEIYEAIDATWPARRRIEDSGWLLREGGGGGNRVSAATAIGERADLAAMEAAQASFGQLPLVMVREGESILDSRLEAAGYRLRDAVTIYLAGARELASPPPPVSAFAVSWPPVAVQTEIWEAGGIGAERQAVMERAAVTKCALLGRTSDQAAGAAFVALAGRIAMIHAIEVVPRLRRKGVARNMIRGGAIWATSAGAEWVAILVTDANRAANALYASMGMVPAYRYHYREKPAGAA